MATDSGINEVLQNYLECAQKCKLTMVIQDRELDVNLSYERLMALSAPDHEIGLYRLALCLDEQGVRLNLHHPISGRVCGWIADLTAGNMLGLNGLIEIVRLSDDSGCV